VTDRVPTDDEAKKFGQWYGAGASPKTAPSADGGGGGGWMSSIGAGVKGAAKEATGWTGLAPEWSKEKDPEHPTAEWLGREGASLAPMAGLDMVAPEIGFLPTATRLGRLANTALNATAKGAIGGAASQPDRAEGAKTGAEVGAGGAALRMLPRWAKLAGGGALAGAAGASTLGHEMGAGTPYIPAWAVHHILTPLAALAAAAAKAPTTSGAVGSQIENAMSGGNSQ
jgi:hypothetical protein